MAMTLGRLPSRLRARLRGSWQPTARPPTSARAGQSAGRCLDVPTPATRPRPSPLLTAATPGHRHLRRRAPRPGDRRYIVSSACKGSAAVGTEAVRIACVKAVAWLDEPGAPAGKNASGSITPDEFVKLINKADNTPPVHVTGKTAAGELPGARPPARRSRFAAPARVRVPGVSRRRSAALPRARDRPQSCRPSLARPLPLLLTCAPAPRPRPPRAPRAARACADAVGKTAPEVVDLGLRALSASYDAKSKALTIKTRPLAAQPLATAAKNLSVVAAIFQPFVFPVFYPAAPPDAANALNISDPASVAANPGNFINESQFPVLDSANFKAVRSVGTLPPLTYVVVSRGPKPGVSWHTSTRLAGATDQWFGMLHALRSAARVDRAPEALPAQASGPSLGHARALC